MSESIRRLTACTSVAILLAAGLSGGGTASGADLSNPSFEDGLNHWTTTGTVLIDDDGFSGASSVRLIPSSDQTAEASQRVEGLQPQTRYTLAARVWTNDHLVPPILGIRKGAQIDKASGWVAITDSGRWLERRFEVFTEVDQTSLDIYLRAWKTSRTAMVKFDDLRLIRGRIDPPAADPGAPAWVEPPAVVTVPDPGGDLLRENAWMLGIEATQETLEGEPTIRLLSTADTSRARQVPELDLPPNRVWTLTAEARVDPGVTANLYVTGEPDFFANVAITGTQWHPVSLTLATDDHWVGKVKVTLENWKNQPGAAWFRNIQWTATGDEWSPTTHEVPLPPTAPLVTTFDDGLNPDDWLISTKSWGGDNGGVSPRNVSIVDDLDDGVPIRALRLQANGDDYTGPIEHQGRSTRVGSAIATRQYFASGRYTVRARVAPELGAVTAFWPFHYIDYQTAEPGYWHEPNPRRNTEIDWEFPTDLTGSGESQAATFGLDPAEIAFTNARTNSWGGQFGGEGGEHKGRRILLNDAGDIVDVAEDSRHGIYHDYTIEWHSGSDLGDEGETRDQIGCVRWYFDDILIDELDDVAFGQGNVPFRAARFWIGVWFAAAGYGDEVGWGGSPDFDETALYIASVSIEPFNEPRDTWVRETVPNIEWATPGAYPSGPVAPPCPADLTDDARVDVSDVLRLLETWGTPAGDLTGDGRTDVDDLLAMLRAWGDCGD